MSIINKTKNSKTVINILLEIRNKINIKDNRLLVNNIHFADNTFTVNGYKNDIEFIDESYSRNTRITVAGDNNRISFGSKTVCSGNSLIRINGSNNTVLFSERILLNNISILINGNNNNIFIKDDGSMTEVEMILERDNNTVVVGEGSTFHGRKAKPISFSLDEETEILVGKDCMIANDVQFRSSDNHSIISIDGKRINPAENITVGDHVWICMRSLILKGTNIGNNSVVGAGSICNKDYIEDHVLIVGTPAIIKKNNIDWDRERKDCVL